MLLSKRSSPDEARELHKFNLCGERSIIPLFLLHRRPDVICRPPFTFLSSLVTKTCLIDSRKLAGEGELAGAKISKKRGKCDGGNIVLGVLLDRLRRGGRV